MLNANRLPHISVFITPESHSGILRSLPVTSDNPACPFLSAVCHALEHPCSRYPQPLHPLRPIASASALIVLSPAQGLPSAIPCTTDRTSVHTALAVFPPLYPHTPYVAQYRALLASAIYPATPSVSDKRYRLSSLPAHTHYCALQSYLLSVQKVRYVIQSTLNTDLPESYDKPIFDAKTDLLLNHFIDMAVQGYGWARA